MKKWFSNLKVSQKLMLISIFFVLPDSVMLYLFITAINDSINFARMEQKGNQYQRPLEELLELIPQHRSLAQQALDGRPGAGEARVRKAAQIDAAFNELSEVDARIGVELQFTDEGLAKRHRENYRVQTVSAAWQQLKKQVTKLDQETCAKRHLDLVAAIRTMITHAGDTSNLILDPDLDSYYLMDATLLALPQNQDRLAAVMASGEAILKQPYITPQDRQQCAIYATLLQEADLDRVEGSVRTAIREDPNFYGVSPTLQERVPPALDEYLSATQRFIKLTKRFAYLDKVDVTIDEYLDAGNKARDASFNLWRIADQEVDTLLQRRIESYQHRRARSLLVAACALLAAVGFVTFITRSISRPLRQQASVLREVNDTLEAEIAERKLAEEEMDRMHNILLESSRQSGMAEVAAGVLHNVGNVLNSVNVSGNVISERLRRSKVSELRKIAGLLTLQAADFAGFVARDPRGPHIPELISCIAEALRAEHAGLLEEVEALILNIGHIKGIVSMQQDFAKGHGITEPLIIQSLVDDAIKINSGSLGRHHIAVVQAYEEVPQVSADRHLVLQILVNLLRNAKQAIEASSIEPRRIVVKIQKNGADYVRIAVQDTGIGIAPENLTSIFSHGFTTKKDGHGFGLHSSALVAARMGGSLQVHSDGPGTGATFTLELPVHHAMSAAAAA